MDEELERELVDEHPDLYELYDLDMDDIDGPTPQLTAYGFQCGDGWVHLLDVLSEFIDNQGVDVRVVQVKEKFGGLRFYYDVTAEDEEIDERRVRMIHGAVQFAQQMSQHTCEECGQPGELRTDRSWIRTLCDDCDD